MVKYHKNRANGKRNRRQKRKRSGNEDGLNEDEPDSLTAKPSDSGCLWLPRDVGRTRAFGHSGCQTLYAPAWTFKPRKAAASRKRAGSANECWVELHKDVMVGRDALTRLANASWWGWDQGSTLFFWRWPARHQQAVRDGTKLFVKKELLPHHFKRQLWPSDESHRSKMMEKLEKVRSRGYILPGQVNSLTGFLQFQRERMTFVLCMMPLRAVLMLHSGRPTLPYQRSIQYCEMLIHELGSAI